MITQMYLDDILNLDFFFAQKSRSNDAYTFWLL